MKQLSTDQAIKLIVAMIVGLALLSGMTSCGTTKAPYHIGDGWQKAPTKSSMTGYTYILR